VGRAKEGNTAAVTPAAPLPTVAPPRPSERATVKAVPTPPASGDRTARGTSDRATAPQQSADSRTSSGTGAGLSSPGLSAYRAGERAAVATTPDRTGNGVGASNGAAKDVVGPLVGTGNVPSATETRGVAPSGVAEIGGPLDGVGETRAAAPGGTADKTTGVPGAAGDKSAGTPGAGADRIAGVPSGTGEVTVGGATGEVRSDSGTGTGGAATTEGGGPPSQGRPGGRGPGGVAITTPQNGYQLSPDDPPIVVVRGQVEDPEISKVTLLVNARRVEVRVRDGKFHYPLVIVDPTTKISAEISSSSTRTSEAIVVHAAPNSLTTGVILLDWGEVKPGGAIDMAATWRARADRLDGQSTKLFVKQAPLPDDIPVTAFYLRNMQAGVYTFMLGYRGLGGGTPFVPKFYLTSPGIPTAREMKSLSLAGSGKLPAVRVLLPQAVLWDQDDWFTGRSEGSDTMTKFRDDGTTWIEFKGR
jgi:hypothetical protein